MKNMYKLLLVFLFVPLGLMASDTKGKYTKTKAINKEFSVSSDNTVKISNKYGNIDVVTWNENRVVIDISITVNGNDESKVEKRLEQIDVEFNQSSNTVSAKTLIEKGSSSWSFWGKKSKIHMEINYTVKMPKSNHADFSNDYGAISLDELSGSAKIDCDYGKVLIGTLNNNKNSINIDYSNKSNIDYMKNGSINADYSGIHIEESGNIDLNADYSDVSLGTVATLDYNCDYGNLKVGTSGKITGNSDYTNTTIANLNGGAFLDSDYGSFKVGHLGSNFGSIVIKTSYSRLAFGVGSSTGFNINATMSHTGFKGKDGFNFTKEITKGSTKTYEGSYGNSNGSNTITLKTSYGSLAINKK